MSRIGNKPIEIPSGVTVQEQGGTIEVKGPKGILTQGMREPIGLKLEGQTINMTRPDDTKTNKALHGLVRSLVANMIDGVTKGFEKKLELHGVGFRATLQGKNLSMALGFSHPVNVVPPTGIEFEVSKKMTDITVKGIDKQLVGQVAANVRAFRPVEPYKGKGIRYVGERVIKKAGKSVAAGK
jgi:large subunit ribosomal protein L6